MSNYDPSRLSPEMQAKRKDYAQRFYGGGVAFDNAARRQVESAERTARDEERKQQTETFWPRVREERDTWDRAMTKALQRWDPGITGYMSQRRFTPVFHTDARAIDDAGARARETELALLEGRPPPEPYRASPPVPWLDRWPTMSPRHHREAVREAQPQRVQVAAPPAVPAIAVDVDVGAAWNQLIALGREE